MSAIILYSDDELLVGMTRNKIGIYRKMPEFKLKPLFTSTSIQSVIEHLQEILSKKY